MTSSFQPYPQLPPDGGRAVNSLAVPAAIRQAVWLILAGAVLAVAERGLDAFVLHRSVVYFYASAPSGTTVRPAPVLASALIGAVLQGGLWLWMAWKVRSGRPWARVLSTVFFAILCLGLIVSAVTIAARNETMAVPSLIVTLAQVGVGLGAVVLLYRPASDQFFAAAKHARLAASYARSSARVAYPGVPAAGYPQPGYYGGQGTPQVPHAGQAGLPPQHWQPPQ